MTEKTRLIQQILELETSSGFLETGESPVLPTRLPLLRKRLEELKIQTGVKEWELVVGVGDTILDALRAGYSGFSGNFFIMHYAPVRTLHFSEHQSAFAEVLSNTPITQWFQALQSRATQLNSIVISLNRTSNPATAHMEITVDCIDIINSVTPFGSSIVFTFHVLPV